MLKKSGTNTRDLIFLSTLSDRGISGSVILITLFPLLSFLPPYHVLKIWLKENNNLSNTIMAALFGCSCYCWLSRKEKQIWLVIPHVWLWSWIWYGFLGLGLHWEFLGKAVFVLFCTFSFLPSDFVQFLDSCVQWLRNKTGNYFYA